MAVKFFMPIFSLYGLTTTGKIQNINFFLEIGGSVTKWLEHQLDLFQVVPGSTPHLHLYIVNWSASCQLDS